MLRTRQDVHRENRRAQWIRWMSGRLLKGSRRIVERETIPTMIVRCRHGQGREQFRSRGYADLLSWTAVQMNFGIRMVAFEYEREETAARDGTSVTIRPL